MMHLNIRCLIYGIGFLSLLFTTQALAQTPPPDGDPNAQSGLQAQTPPNTVAPSGLPIPRFVSLRSGKVNLRTGPGANYPIEWVMVRRHMPVEVIAEFDVWRKIRDWQGTVGWVHQQMLDGRRMALVMGTSQMLRREASEQSAPVAQMESGVIARILECAAAWCRVEASGYKGWLPRGQIFGTYPAEVIKE